MNFFDSNIALLESRGAHCLDLNTQLGEALAEFVDIDAEGNWWFVDENNNPIRITTEADKESLPNPDLRQLIFFFGLISVDEILNVAKHANPDSYFIILEPNLSILQFALNHQDLSRLSNLKFMIAAIEPSQVDTILKSLLATPVILLIKQPVFYFNSYYRQREIDLMREFIVNIRETIRHKFFRIGNSILDSLLGLIHNMQNLENMVASPDVGSLKDKFKGCPAFIVAAGPSLDKNIEELKRIQNKGLIIAVDAIADKLVKNGITPHFMSSVERVDVWELLVEKKSYPEDIYLVGPPVLQPPVVNRFGKRVLLPMRQTVREYLWLSDILDLSDDYKVWMGASCAHVAMGLALHLGASPIVLVGQDLAYGEDVHHTHAGGTIHDEFPLQPEELITVEGYYGKDVQTQDIWQNFRLMFEDKIKDLAEPFIINATEGGARIKGTVQHPLSEVVSQYCCRELGDIRSLLDETVRVKVDWIAVTDKINQYVKRTDKLSLEVKKHQQKLEKIRDYWAKYTSKPNGAKKIHETLKKTDRYYHSIPEDQLLYHNLQGPMIVLMQKFYTIQDDGTLESLYKNLLLQIELCEMISNTSRLIAGVVEENYPWHLGGSAGVVQAIER